MLGLVRSETVQGRFAVVGVLIGVSLILFLLGAASRAASVGGTELSIRIGPQLTKLQLSNKMFLSKRTGHLLGSAMPGQELCVFRPKGSPELTHCCKTVANSFPKVSKLTERTLSARLRMQSVSASPCAAR